MLLAHFWELIVINDNCDIGEDNKTGLEHNHKFLKFFRIWLACKTLQEANLQDCLDRLWLKFNPGVCDAGPKKQCSKY